MVNFADYFHAMPAERRGEFIYRDKVVCADGFTLSIQASRYHYCSPRDGTGPYAKVEVGYPSWREELLMAYAEDPDEPSETVYGYVPLSVVAEIVAKHGGVSAKNPVR